VLFKEKLLLSNCDSVKKLKPGEIRKRFLTGMAFADGVVVSPNTLIDNLDINSLISRRNIVKYLNEEGHGKLVIRGFNLKDELSLVDYFESLPDDFIISSLRGSPQKISATPQQLSSLKNRLELTQTALNNIGITIENVSLPQEALREEIYKRISDAGAIGHFFQSDGDRILFQHKTANFFSRSQWYQASKDHFQKESELDVARFKSEIVDPAYNSLFAIKGEGFLQDNIRIINGVPDIILDSGVLFKSLKNEIQLIEYPIKAFEIISSFGAGEVVKYLTDEALSYVEDKMTESGEHYLSRKNWFGMYEKMKNKIGMEIK
jgi:hypothetical protein